MAAAAHELRIHQVRGEVDALKIEIAEILAAMYDKILEPIVTTHPDLKPPEWGP